MGQKLYLVGTGSVGTLLSYYLAKESTTRKALNFKVISRQTTASLDRRLLFRSLLPDSKSSQPISFTVPSLPDLSSLVQSDFYDSTFIICTKAYHVATFCNQLVKAKPPNCIPLVIVTCNGIPKIRDDLRDLNILDEIDFQPLINSHGTFTDLHSVTNHATKGFLKFSKKAPAPMLNLFSQFPTLNPIPVEHDEMEFLIWEKLLVNCCINPITVIFRCKNGEIATNPKAFDKCSKILCELQRFLVQIIGSHGGDRTSLNYLMELVKAALALTSENYSSMYQDIIVHKRESEIDYFNGYFVALAKSLSSLPIQENLELVNEIKHFPSSSI